MRELSYKNDKYFLEFKMCSKDSFDNFNFNFNNFIMPYFYNLNNIYQKPKLESIIGYKLLYLLYFYKFNEYLDMAEIVLDANKKPCFDSKFNTNLYFNISHSKNFVACVLTNFEVGLDIEEDRIIKPIASKKFMSEQDFSYIKKNDMSQVQVWNIKEAYSKYLGLGLRLDFKSTHVNQIISKQALITHSFNKNFVAICFDKNIKLNNLKIIKNKIK